MRHDPWTRWTTRCAKAALICAVAVGCATHSPPDPRVGPIEPTASPGEDYGQVGGLLKNETRDIGDLHLRNPTHDPATITGISLIPGGGSDHAFIEPAFFLVGTERAIGGADGPPNWVRERLHAPYHPAIGYDIPTIDDDPDQHGALLIIRIRMNGLPDASFDGVDVTYEWNGDEYVWHSPYDLLVCASIRHHPLPPLCNG